MTALRMAVTCVAGSVLLLSTLHAQQAGNDIRESRFFKVDVTAKKIVATQDRIKEPPRLQLVSVTTDQPQYWPNEKVFLKVAMPTRGKANVVATLTKKDATGRDSKGTLDEGGVLVFELLDGTKSRVELGEYRVEVRTEDNALRGSSTFSVVEGTLGALSLAHEFKQVTSVDELDKLPAGWFLGNASGAGKRWGNGLSFKNELRVANQPYQGEVLIISRCMLPGCNGIAAGREKKVTVENGRIEATMEVGGHSGPFQIELITPQGSLRHQFEGSSHVERDFVMASFGVTWSHRAGLAPYENTTQVPGRQIFLEKSRGSDDPFEIDDVIARDGHIQVRITRAVKSGVIVALRPEASGAATITGTQSGDWKSGHTLKIPVDSPYTFIALGGFADGQFREGWAMAFQPAQMKVTIDAPPQGAPAMPMRITVDARGVDGKPLAVSGIIEVFDNRVASRSALSPIHSAIGDSIRNTSQQVAYWEDRTGIDPRRQAEAEKAAEEMAEMDSRGAGAMAPPPPASPSPMVSSPKPQARAMKMKKNGAPGGAMRMAQQPGGAHSDDEEEAPQEIIREGEKKVVLCQAVRTDASGRAVVDVTLPPQLGRVAVRFVAFKGTDFAHAQSSVDVSKRASVEIRMPRILMSGARISATLDVVNGTKDTLTLVATGAGLLKPFNEQIAPGRKTTVLPLVGTDLPGTLKLELLTRDRKVLDTRKVAVAGLGVVPVTSSRLVVSTGQPIPLEGAAEYAVYPGAGALLGAPS